MSEQPPASEPAMQTAEPDSTSLSSPDSSDQRASGSRAYCVLCGAGLEHGARFCASCGHPVDSDAGASPTEDIRPQKKSKRLVVGVVIALLVVAAVSGAVGVTSHQQAVNRAAAAAAEEKLAAKKKAAAEAAARHAEQARELRDVFNKVAAIDSAVSVGINQRDFSAKVQDAQAAIDAYGPPDSDAAAVVAELKTAMNVYSTSAAYWNAAIVDPYAEVDESLLSSGWQTAGDTVATAHKKVDAYEGKASSGSAFQ